MSKFWGSLQERLEKEKAEKEKAEKERLEKEKVEKAEAEKKKAEEEKQKKEQEEKEKTQTRTAQFFRLIYNPFAHNLLFCRLVPQQDGEFLNRRQLIVIYYGGLFDIVTVNIQ